MAGYAFPLTLGAAQPAAAAMPASAPGDYVDPYAAQLAALQARIAQPGAPMYSEEEVAQRKGANARDYQLGLLGLLSGDQNLGAVGGQVFKQALAARQPHVTEKGVADPLTGQFNYNPAYQRERDETQLDQLQRYSAQSRAQYDENRRKAGEAAELARQRSEDQRILRGMMAGNTAGRNADVQQSRLWTVEDRMADDFRKETSKDQGVIGAFHGLRATAAKGDAASDMGMIFQFMKTLDPSSTVREGEFATAQNAAGIPARVMNQYNRALTGNFLNKQQRAEMLGVAERLAQQAEANVNDTAKRYRATGKRRPGLDLDTITSGYGADDAAPAPAAAPKPPGKAAALSAQEASELEQLRQRFKK